ATGDNTDAFHVYRIAYNRTDDFYWVWRDGVLLYGTDNQVGIFGTNSPFNDSAAFFIGDFSGNISGEWEVDYIRLNPADVAPGP
ncbi:MAG: hypothetical protein HKN82_19175, partial [Akkermansiaceae bacterium]|nr:hypothetical protein [Akkermansiaceae bacterium]